MSTSESALQRLRATEPGVISDCMMRLGLSGWMDDIHPIGGGQRRAVGWSRTLQFGPKRGDGAWSKSMYATIQDVNPGEILVFGAGGTQQNLMGDNMATFAQNHGLAAMVTDSTARDSAGIAALSMPVFAKGAAVRLPLNIEPVEFDIPIACGGAQVRPRDLIVASEDGVIVLPGSRIDDILFQLDDVEPIELALQNAIAARVALSEVEMLIKRKKEPRRR